MPVLWCSVPTLRSALNHLFDPRALGASPLIRMVGREGRGSRQARLRQVLISAIDSLKPGDDVPAQSSAWRVYEILYYRYVQQCTQEEVAIQLGLSVRHLKREQRRALEVLAELLRQQSGLNVIPDSGDAEMESVDEDESLAANEELQWLEDAAPSEPVQLATVLPTVEELVQAIASRYGVRLTISCGEGVPPLAVNAVALRQVLLSLLSVAVRQAANGPLLVSAGRCGWHVELHIRAGARPGAEMTSEDDANLTIARRLVRTCGGSLSRSANGDVFAATLLLPAAAQLPVLVIDDNLDVQRLLQRYAMGTRYRVFGTRDPQQAFAVIQKTEPQIIVLDVVMPEVDGWEFLGRLRQHPLTCRIPVIAVTILAQEELALSLGVSGFLRKPVSRREFLAALDRLAPSGKMQFRPTS